MPRPAKLFRSSCHGPFNELNNLGLYEIGRGCQLFIVLQRYGSAFMITGSNSLHERIYYAFLTREFLGRNSGVVSVWTTRHGFIAAGLLTFRFDYATD